MNWYKDRVVSVTIQATCLVFIAVCEPGWWRLLVLVPTCIVLAEVRFWCAADRRKEEHKAYMASLVYHYPPNDWSNTPAAGPFRGTYH